MRAEEVEVIPGLAGPREFTQDVTDSTTGHRVSMRIRFDEAERRYGCEELRIIRRADGPPVSTETLRGLPLGEMLRAAVSLVLLVEGRPDLPGLASGSLRELPNPAGIEPWGRRVPEGLAKEGPTDRVLRWVAHFYRYGVALGDTQPTAAIQDLMGVSRATAGRWVTAARERGYLGAALRGRSGEAVRR